MYQNLFPIGSVVLLKGGEKRLMVCGRVVAKAGGDEIYDYVGVTYPEGIADPQQMIFFNHDDVDMLFFVGFQDAEELSFRAQVLSQLNNAVVRDGQIVPAEQE